MERILTPGPAARRAGVTPETIRKWADTGRLPCRRTETGVRLFDITELDRFVAARPPLRRRAAAAGTRG